MARKPRMIDRPRWRLAAAVIGIPVALAVEAAYDHVYQLAAIQPSDRTFMTMRDAALARLHSTAKAFPSAADWEGLRAEGFVPADERDAWDGVILVGARDGDVLECRSAGEDGAFGTADDFTCAFRCFIGLFWQPDLVLVR